MALEGFGRFLIYIGVIIVVMGGILLFASKVTWFGRLPGDVMWKGSGWTVYFPIATMVLVSIVLTIILNIFFRK